jgi:hypothetical protein
MTLNSSFIMAAFAMTMGKTAATLPHHHERTSLFCGQRAESLVMLVNEFVLSTDLAVQNHRANYSVRKLTAATIITLIFQPAIGFLRGKVACIDVNGHHAINAWRMPIAQPSISYAWSPFLCQQTLTPR